MAWIRVRFWNLDRVRQLLAAPRRAFKYAGLDARRWSLALALAAGSLNGIATQSACACSTTCTLTDDPFQNAQLVPDDVRVFVSVVNGSALLDQLTATPMASGLYEAFERSNTGKAWKRLSESAHRDPRILFDKLLGSKFILIIPPETRGEDSHVQSDNAESDLTNGTGGEENTQSREPGLFDEWLAIAEVDHRTAEEVVLAFDARVTRRLDGVPVLVSEDGALLLSYRAGHLYLGTAGLESRFNDLVYNPLATTLMDSADFQKARCCQDGQIGMFIRSSHQHRADRNSDDPPGPPHTDWLSLSVSLDSDGALIRWRSPARQSRSGVEEATAAMMGVGADTQTADTGEGIVWSILDGLARRPDVLYASVIDTGQKQYRPSSTSPGTTLSWLLRRAERSTGEGVRTPAAFVAITSTSAQARTPGHAESRKLALTGPDIAVFHAGLVVDDVYAASTGLDEYILSIVRKMESAWSEQDPEQRGISLPDVSAMQPHEERRIDLSPRTGSIEGWPGVDALTLYWRSRRVDPSSPVGLWMCSTDETAQSTLFDRLSCTLLRLQRVSNDDAMQQENNGSWNRRIWEDVPSLCDTAVLTGAGMVRAGGLSHMLASWPAVNASTDHPIYRELYDYRLILEGMTRAYWRSLLVSAPPAPGSVSIDATPAMQTEVRIMWSDSEASSGAH